MPDRARNLPPPSLYSWEGSRGTMPKAARVPPSVGFAIVQMIDAGLLDDCVGTIGAHAAMRSGRLANQRAATEKQLAEILADDNEGD